MPETSVPTPSPCAHCIHVEAEKQKPPFFTQGHVGWTVLFAALGLGGAVFIGASVQSDADRLGTLTVTGVTIAAVAGILRAVSHQRREVSDLVADHLGKQLAITAVAFTFLIATTQLGDYFKLTVQPIILGIASAVVGVLLAAIAVVQITSFVRSSLAKRKNRREAMDARPSAQLSSPTE